MSTAVAESVVVINGQEYMPTIEDGHIVEVKRFNKTYGMWVSVKFSKSVFDAEKELLDMLISEYVQRTCDGKTDI